MSEKETLYVKMIHGTLTQDDINMTRLERMKERSELLRKAGLINVDVEDNDGGMNLTKDGFGQRSRINHWK